MSAEKMKARYLWMWMMVAFFVALVFLFFDRRTFFQSYLLAYIFVLGLSLGSLALRFIFVLTGGKWGESIKTVIRPASSFIPVLAIFFIPIAFGLKDLYPWARPEMVADDPGLQHKTDYLNVSFFLIRAAFYFFVWSLLAFILNRLLDQHQRKGRDRFVKGAKAVSSIGLILYALTMSGAAVDWMMSLEPHWYSTIYGLIVITGQMLTALAFAVVLKSKGKPGQVLSESETTAFHDLGTLLFALVMMWAYLAFSQFLIIWSGNLPSEATWYELRIHFWWKPFALILILTHFFIPFLILLNRPIKRNPRFLAQVAVFLLVARVFDLMWLILPSMRHQAFPLQWSDPVLLTAMFLFWIYFYNKKATADGA